MSEARAVTTQPSFLATRRGKLMLALLCLVAFLDFVDGSIVNIALPSIRHDLHFSVQGLQWVISGYLITYGGFMLLGGRAGDLLRRRRILVAGTSLFGISSLAGGFAGSAGVLVGARLAQGVGAAMMMPAALSILTTMFKEGARKKGASGCASTDAQYRRPRLPRGESETYRRRAQSHCGTDAHKTRFKVRGQMNRRDAPASPQRLVSRRQRKQLGVHQSATESPLLRERLGDNGVAHHDHGSDRQLACRQSRSATAIARPTISSGVTDRCASSRDEVSRD